MLPFDPKHLFHPPLTQAQYDALSAQAKEFLANMLALGLTFPDDDAEECQPVHRNAPRGNSHSSALVLDLRRNSSANEARTGLRVRASLHPNSQDIAG